MSTVSTIEQEQIETVTQEVLARLRSKLLKSVKRKEFEDILDGNFRLNDEMCTALQQAWNCAMRLDCQLGEADRPEDDRNQWLQAMATERDELVQTKAAMESRLLCAKLDIQTAFANAGLLRADELAVMLQENVDLRRRFFSLGQQIEDVVCSAQFRLRQLGERPDARIENTTSSDVGNTKRWRDEFNSARHANDALLQALTHPDAAVAIPACALEERYDHNWRFNLELVGLLEKVMAQCCQSENAREDIESEARNLLSELEVQLPALLESKLYTQEAAARDLAQDTERAETHVRAAKKVQSQLWSFLTKNQIDLSNVVPTKFAEEMLPHPAAFGNARSTNGDGFMDEPEYPPLLRLLTYNIFMRAPAPKIVHNTDDDRKDERLSRFIKHLERFDVVLLQEVVGSFSLRRDFLIRSAESMGFRDWLRSDTNVWPQFLIDSGLLILSRLPIVKKASCTFQPGIHTDRLYAKGALYVKIQCGPQGPFLHVCTTHLQSTPSESWYQQARDVRQSQLTELMSFIIENTNDEPDERYRRSWPLLLGGDFGLNGRRSSIAGSSHSEEYSSMITQLQTGLGELRDLLFDVCGSHPVTYADTRLTGNGEVPVERVLTAPSAYESDFTKRQRLDYLFFFPPEMNADAPRFLREPLVPGTCRIEKFLVDRSRDVGAPITQLSDHYGIEATIAVIADDSSPCTDLCTNAAQGDDGVRQGSEDERSSRESDNVLPSSWSSDTRGGVDPAFWAAADAFASGLSPEGNFDFQTDEIFNIPTLCPQPESHPDIAPLLAMSTEERAEEEC